MDTDRWDRVQQLYLAALELPLPARAEFLSQACPNDPELRREVESLLAFEGKADELLESPVWPGETTPPELRVMAEGAQLGVFRIGELLGCGGTGEVYRATDTRLHRDVAIKMLRAEYAHQPDWLARFQREARALASLNDSHICALHDIGPNYLVMEYIEGETLAARIKKGALPLDEALRIAIEVAGALLEAHRKGIVHRDLKPGNIMLTARGAVLLDFGLAKSRRPVAAGEDAITAAVTGDTQVEGTAPYMSPEQIQGKEVDARSDIFSFGLVLYEMITGKRAFEGSNQASIIAAILEREAPELEPVGLNRVVKACLEKDPARRIQQMDDVRALVSHELKALETSLAPARPVRLSRNAWFAVGAAFLLAGVLAGWLWRQSSRQRWALETAAPEIARLVDAGEYIKAAALTREARSVLPKDPTLAKLWMSATGAVSIASVPSGADVSIRLYRDNPNSWQALGKTPLRKIRVPRDAYVWRVAKPGYATSYVIGRPPGDAAVGYSPPFELAWNLRPVGSVPPEMVVVAGGRVGLAYPQSQAPRVQIDDFLIDRHEVTNEDYKKFVEAGGYQKPDFWKQPFVKDGRAIPWEEAISSFHDATGRPGPATWEVGDYPKGQEKYPVAGVSWYEAAAYADFAGKGLPTAYHWTLASQATQGIRGNGLVALSTGFASLIAQGSNFRGGGTRPVGSEGSLSGFGTTDMAGNVKEWCWNETRDGKRFILGGGFGDPEYQFTHTDAQSPWDRRASFGFRCAKLDTPASAEAAAHIEVAGRDYWSQKPAPDNEVKIYAALYAYDRTELNARVEETAPALDSVREKVTFDAAYGHERVGAYLFSPRNASQPFQTVVLFPGAGAFLSDQIDLPAIEDQFDFLLKSGRALFVPVFKGSWDRQDGYQAGGKPQGMHRDHVVAWGKDLGRSLDYLETRKEVDAGKVALFGVSLGGTEAPILAVVEHRIRAVIISSGGFQLRRDLPEVDPFNFAPRVTVPVLMLSGRYDATFPLESSQNPLFQFLGTPEKNKKHVIYEGGHGAFPHPEAVRECLDWLDKYLGPVRR